MQLIKRIFPNLTLHKFAVLFLKLAVILVLIGITAKYLGKYFTNYIYKTIHLPIESRRFGTQPNLLYLHSFNKQIADHVFSDLYINNQDFNTLSNDQVNNIKQICITQISQEQDRIYLSKAYNCLGKVFDHQSTNQDNIFKAIKYTSNALEIIYLPEHAKLLASHLIKGLEDKLPDKFKDLSPFFNGVKVNEITLLNELISLNIPDLTARANYRLHFIYKFGRSSANEIATPDIKISAEKLIETIKFSNIQPTNKVDIAIIINEAFAAPTSVVIASALLNSDLSSLYHFHIIMDPNSPLTPAAKQKLTELKWIKNYDISFINYSQEVETVNIIREKVIKCFKNASHFPPVIAYRLYLDKILPNLDKVLYLDADLLVLEDLNYFNQIDIENYFMAAAIDLSILPSLRTNCELTFKEYYINSGVIFFNLKKMRNENALAKMTESIINNPMCDYELVDQDILNLAFEDYIYYLNYRWNNLIVNRSFQKMIPEPVSFIKHFSGVHKPWQFLKGEFLPAKLTPIISAKKEQEHYWNYVQITPWITK